MYACARIRILCAASAVCVSERRALLALDCQTVRRARLSDRGVAWRGVLQSNGMQVCAPL